MRVAALEAAIAADRGAGIARWPSRQRGHGEHRRDRPAARDRRRLRAARRLAARGRRLRRTGDPDARYRPRLRALARADSVALDPHKWLYVPVEAGLVLVRDGAAMRDTFSLVPPYLRTDGSRGVGGPPWFSEYGFQQTRGFRALKVWMALKHYGLAGYAAPIEHDLALADHLAARVASAPDLELVAAA